MGEEFPVLIWELKYREISGKIVVFNSLKKSVNCNLAGSARGQWRTDMCVIRDSWAVPGNVSAYQAEAIAQPS